MATDYYDVHDQWITVTHGRNRGRKYYGPDLRPPRPYPSVYCQDHDQGPGDYRPQRGLRSYADALRSDRRPHRRGPAPNGHPRPPTTSLLLDTFHHDTTEPETTSIAGTTAQHRDMTALETAPDGLAMWTDPTSLPRTQDLGLLALLGTRTSMAKCFC